MAHPPADGFFGGRSPDDKAETPYNVLMASLNGDTPSRPDTLTQEHLTRFFLCSGWGCTRCGSIYSPQWWGHVNPLCTSCKQEIHAVTQTALEPVPTCSQLGVDLPDLPPVTDTRSDGWAQAAERKARHLAGQQRRIEFSPDLYAAAVAMLIGEYAQAGGGPLEWHW